MGFLLLLPFFLIRFGLLALLNQEAVRRAAYFAPIIGHGKTGVLAVSDFQPCDRHLYLYLQDQIIANMVVRYGSGHISYGNTASDCFSRELRVPNRNRHQ